MTSLPKDEKKYTFIEIFVVASAIGIVLFLFMFWASQTPLENNNLAFDWKLIWGAMQDGQITYGHGLYNPPWGTAILLPLSLVPLAYGWGLLAGLSVILLIASVPMGLPLWRKLAAMAMLLLAFPSLRLYIDGNLDALVIGGLWLLLIGIQHKNIWLIAIGFLLVTIKPQTVWLLLILIMWRADRNMWRAGALAGVLIFASLLWEGQAWIQEIQAAFLEERDPSSGGIAALAVSESLGVPVLLRYLLTAFLAVTGLWIALKRTPTLEDLNTHTIGLLAASSMLASPYTNVLSMTILLCFCVAPLLDRYPFIGFGLWIGYILPLFMLITGVGKGWYDNNGFVYWGIILLLTWAIATQTNPIQKFPKFSVDSP